MGLGGDEGSETTGKVIIHKSRGGVSLVEQETIENVSVAYLKFIIICLRKRNHLQFMQLFCAKATIFKKSKLFLPTKTWKKNALKSLS